jgi:hypothetical protein
MAHAAVLEHGREEIIAADRGAMLRLFPDR